MELYTKEGWLNVSALMNLKGCNFLIIIGGRGTGKSFGVMKELYDRDTSFVYMRRTQKEINATKVPKYNPFRALLKVYPEAEITADTVSEDTIGFFRTIEGVREPEPWGVGMALSTFANVRGLEGDSLEVLWFDEFVGEKHRAQMRFEADAFFNAVETLNHNRELLGKDPLKVVLTANSNDLATPILVYSRLVTKAEQMKAKGQEFYFNPERGVCLVILDKSPISDRKSTTALYRFLGTDSEFSQMSLGNDFAYDDKSTIVSRNLTDYTCIYQVGELAIYEHKSARLWYVCTHARGTPEHFGTGHQELERFKKRAWRLWVRYIDGYVEFETYYCQVLFETYFK